MLSLSFMPINVANIEIMGVWHRTALELFKERDQTLLTFRWGSFWGGGSDIFAGSCAQQGGQYRDYGLMLPHSPVTIQDARSAISDTLLTPISRMGQQACYLSIYL